MKAKSNKLMAFLWRILGFILSLAGLGIFLLGLVGLFGAASGDGTTSPSWYSVLLFASMVVFGFFATSPFVDALNKRLAHRLTRRVRARVMMGSVGVFLGGIVVGTVENIPAEGGSTENARASQPKEEDLPWYYSPDENWYEELQKENRDREARAKETDEQERRERQREAERARKLAVLDNNKQQKALYKEMGPPKLLYRCEDSDIFVAVGANFGSFNILLEDAYSTCGEGNLKIVKKAK